MFSTSRFHWDPPKTVQEVMEAVHSYADITFMYRAYDYSGKALLRACHDVRYFSGMVENNKEGEKKQLKMMEKFINDVFAANAASGTSGTAPVTYKQILKKARQTLAAEGISDSNLFSGDSYSAAKGGEDKQRKNDDKRDRPAPRDNRGDRQGRSRQDDRRGREPKDHIGLFCGKNHPSHKSSY